MFPHKTILYLLITTYFILLNGCGGGGSNEAQLVDSSNEAQLVDNGLDGLWYRRTFDFGAYEADLVLEIQKNGLQRVFVCGFNGYELDNTLDAIIVGNTAEFPFFVDFIEGNLLDTRQYSITDNGSLLVNYTLTDEDGVELFSFEDTFSPLVGNLDEQTCSADYIVNITSSNLNTVEVGIETNLIVEVQYLIDENATTKPDFISFEIDGQSRNQTLDISDRASDTIYSESFFLPVLANEQDGETITASVTLGFNIEKGTRRIQMATLELKVTQR